MTITSTSLELAVACNCLVSSEIEVTLWVLAPIDFACATKSTLAADSFSVIIVLNEAAPLPVCNLEITAKPPLSQRIKVNGYPCSTAL